MNTSNKKCREILEKLGDGFHLGCQGNLWFVWKTSPAEKGRSFKKVIKEFVNEKACLALIEAGILVVSNDIRVGPDGHPVTVYRLQSADVTNS